MKLLPDLLLDSGDILFSIFVSRIFALSCAKCVRRCENRNPTKTSSHGDAMRGTL